MAKPQLYTPHTEVAGSNKHQELGFQRLTSLTSPMFVVDKVRKSVYVLKHMRGPAAAGQKQPQLFIWSCSRQQICQALFVTIGLYAACVSGDTCFTDSSCSGIKLEWSTNWSTTGRRCYYPPWGNREAQFNDRYSSPVNELEIGCCVDPGSCSGTPALTMGFSPEPIALDEQKYRNAGWAPSPNGDELWRVGTPPLTHSDAVTACSSVGPGFTLKVLDVIKEGLMTNEWIMGEGDFELVPFARSSKRALWIGNDNACVVFRSGSRNKYNKGPVEPELMACSTPLEYCMSTCTRSFVNACVTLISVKY